MLEKNRHKLAKVGVGLIGAIMATSICSGSGRGDYHTVYQGQSVDDLIIRFMEEHQIPGLSLAIVQAPYITRVVGYGLADLQSRRLVATNSLFTLGQMTNAYTAVAIMQLKEEGKLQLDTPVTTYLTDLPQKWSNIRLRDLLTHSSGLPSYTAVDDFDFSKDYTPEQIISLIKTKELLFSPGSKVNYSATDFYLLGLVIEKTSGMSYQDYVTKNQIERVGLKHTYFISHQKTIKNEINNGTEPFKHSQFLKDPDYINPTEAVVGYSAADGSLMPAKSLSWSATFSDSGILASAQDVSIWDIALAGGILINDPKDKAFLYNPVTLKNGQMAYGNAGWFFPGHKGMMEIKGQLPGFSSFLSRFTASTELVCVTLLVNKDHVPDLDILARKIAGAFDVHLAAPTGSAWSETLQSPYTVKETLDRVEALIKEKGGKVFARVDHSGEAVKAGQHLQPTQVLVLGNPAKGTALMEAMPAMALDLPLRIMATTDSTGQTWLSFTDPVLLAKEYKLDAPQQKTLLKQMSLVLNMLCQKAISPMAIELEANSK